MTDPNKAPSGNNNLRFNHAELAAIANQVVRIGAPVRDLEHFFIQTSMFTFDTRDNERGQFKLWGDKYSLLMRFGDGRHAKHVVSAPRPVPFDEKYADEELDLGSNAGEEEVVFIVSTGLIFGVKTNIETCLTSLRVIQPSPDCNTALDETEVSWANQVDAYKPWSSQVLIIDRPVKWILRDDQGEWKRRIGFLENGYFNGT